MASPSTMSVPYQCQRCNATLRVEEVGRSIWARCPRCGRPGQSPSPVLAAHEAFLEEAVVANDESAARLDVVRLIAVIVLFAAVIFFLFSLLDQDTTQATSAGIIAVIAVIVLARRGGR